MSHSEHRKCLIGIDPGTHTGYAIWHRDHQRLCDVATLKLYQALDRCRVDVVAYWPCEVWFEDARQRTWFGKSGKEMWQGAGSIKRDCSIWQEFLEDLHVPFRAIKPQAGATKWSVKQFEAATGWTERTSEHARDAAMLVYRG